MLTLNYIVYQNVHLDVGFPYYYIFGTKCKARSSVDIKGCASYVRPDRLVINASSCFLIRVCS